MIILHQYPEAFGLPSLSPFCVKVESFLKMAKLPYTVKVELNPNRGPKGKMPFIEDGPDVIADPSFIIEYLLKNYSLEHLEISNPEKKAQASAFKFMIEESLYFILLYSRWVDECGFKVIKREFTPLFPPVVGELAIRYLRKSLIKQSLAQGIGRHTREEVYGIGQEVITSLALFLEQRSFFFEDKLTYFDATAYSFLATILKQRIESPLKEALLREKNLCRYVERLG